MDKISEITRFEEKLAQVGSVVPDLVSVAQFEKERLNNTVNRDAVFALVKRLRDYASEIETAMRG